VTTPFYPRPTPLHTAVGVALTLLVSSHAATVRAAEDAATSTTSAGTATQNAAPIVGDTALTPLFVTANPLGERELISPATAVSGDALTLRAAGNNSLGETLNGLPGVSTTTYGPMVGRPIIRGMDGDRIRLLQNGVAAYDASSLSYDHAVPQDPLSVERIEIIRGPAALLYGGNAIGGVVNTIDNRIPREPIKGVTGTTDVNYTSGNQGRAGAAQIEGGNGRFNFHADVFARKTSDERIPGYARSAAQRAQDDADTAQPYGKLPNSDGRWSGGAVGGSYTWADGYAGLSYNGFQSDYGSVAEDTVRLRMHQDHVAFASEVRNMSGPIERVKFDFGYTDYEHREITDGVTGTTFRNHGYEGRIEARHKRIGPFDGAIGVQFSQNTFSALGSEALVPTTRTTNVALFGLEEWQATQRFKVSLGGRVERVMLSPTAAGNDRFADATDRNFTTGSVSLGGLYRLNPVWSLAADVAYTERAPTFYELYANGPHGATGQYLIGNIDAQKEKSVSTDLALRYASGPNKGSVGVFYNRFTNYLTEYNTGNQVDDDGAVVPTGTADALNQAVYRGVRAEFYGVEASTTQRVFSRGPHHVDIDVDADYTHARNVDTGEPLPRIAPLRVTFGTAYGYGPFGVRASVIHAWQQARVPANDTTTGSYTTLGVSLTYRFHAGRTQWLAYLRGDNLTNQDVRYASSVVRDIAPQMGRSVTLGLRTTF
jgi:iron complex outermembrane receptor protein